MGQYKADFHLSEAETDAIPRANTEWCERDGIPVCFLRPRKSADASCTTFWNEVYVSKRRGKKQASIHLHADVDAGFR